MATYGNRFIFEFVSQNGDDVEIYITKKDFSGKALYRPLGRGPVLKRERNDAILGTSLEIYAECRVDGEFAELYTSSADEFRVVVYKNRRLQWIGYVSPELYAEPDIAPPYDVQIIATDGLGELKNTDFSRLDQSYSLKDHIEYILGHTGLNLDLQLVSSLRWIDDAASHAPSDLLDLTCNLSHLADERNYDVLQDLLASLNACITQQDGKWLLVREADIYDNIEEFSVAEFGSANKTLWWPIGSMSTDIVPAKNKVTLTQENTYKDNILPSLVSGVAGGWELAPGVYYDKNEGAYILNDEAYVQHTKEYPMYPMRTPLCLRISARPLARANVEGDARLYYTIMMQGSLNGVYGTYYLAHTYDDTLDKMVWIWHPDSFLGQYTWKDVQPQQTDDPAITDVEVDIPSSSNAKIDQLTITVGNMPVLSKFPIALYDVVLTQAGQIGGLQLVANISNNAREAMNEEDVMLSSSSDPMLPETMYGVLRLDGGITSWHTPYNSATDLLSFLARDYAMLVALPRMRYRGKLNVPASPSFRIPFLYERDNTYYQLNTYSYDLLNDEIDVELISIPNARVIIDSETVTELPSEITGGGSSSSGGGNSGGGSGEGGGVSTLSGLDDVAISGLADGQALVYDAASGFWKNKKVSAGGEVNYSSIINALGYTPFDEAEFTKANIKSELGISDWALSISMPLASSSARGGIKVGFSAKYQNGSYYSIPVELDSEKAFVKLTKTMVATALGFTPVSSADIEVTKAKVINALGYTPMNPADFTGDSIVAKLGYTPFDADDFTKNNIKSKLGIQNWALGLLPPVYSKSDVGLGNVDNLAASAYLTALSSSTTNAVSITVGGVTKNITAATLKTSLGLQSFAYRSSLGFSELTGIPTTLAGYGIKKNDIITTIGISSWALAVSKPSYTKSEVGLGNVDNLAASAYLTALGSNSTNAVSITVGGTTKNITVATLKSSLGLQSFAYRSSLAFSELTSKPTTLTGYGIAKADLINTIGIEDWALESSKPRYEWSEIGSRPTKLSDFTNDLGLGLLAYKGTLSYSELTGKPTTLAGYGITDAIRYENEIDPTTTGIPAVMGYRSSAGWKAGGPVMLWGTTGYYTRLNVSMEKGDSPKMYISNVYGNTEYDWALFLTDKSIGEHAIAIESDGNNLLVGDKKAKTGYVFGQNGWKAVGPAMTFPQGNYKGLLNMAMYNPATADNGVSAYLGVVYAGTQGKWSLILTEHNIENYVYGKDQTYSATQIENKLNTTVIYSDNIDITSNDVKRHIGYGYAAKGWPGSGPAMSFGTALYNLRLQLAISSSNYPKIKVSQVYNGTAYGWAELMTYESVATGDLDVGRYLCGGTYMIHQSGDDRFLNYGNRVAGDLFVFGKNIRFSPDGGASFPLRVLNNGFVQIHGVNLSAGTSNALKSGAYEADVYYSDSKMILHRNAGYSGTYLNYGGRAETLFLYGSVFSFQSGDSPKTVFSINNGYAEFFKSLTVDGTLTANEGATIPSGKSLKIGDAVISWDATNERLVISKGLYSSGAITAGAKS